TYLERMPVILSAAKDLARRRQRSFAALRMTERTCTLDNHLILCHYHTRRSSMIVKEKYMNEPELPPRSQAKREAIHVAAQELFTRQGFEGTSMDAIAEAAHVSKQTLYRYYENKEALFVATLRRLALHHTAAQTLQEVQGTPIDSLAALEQALVTWAQLTIENIMQPTYLALLRILIAEIPRFPYLGSLFTSAVPQ